MKSTSQTAIILALIMLLLVMAAAFVFVFQGRNQLVNQRNELSTRAAVLEESFSQTQADLNHSLSTRAALEAAAATAEADNVLLEGQLVESQQELDGLTAQLDEVSQTISALEAEKEQVLSQPPQIAVLAPANGSAFVVDTPVEIVVAASDALGITAVNININEAAWQTYDVADLPLFTVTEIFTPTAVGNYEIQTMAVNVNGRSSSVATASFTVEEPPAEIQSANDPNAALRAQIESDVSRIRGLEPTEPVVTTLLTRDQLQQRVESDLLEEYTAEDARSDTLVLSSFDFLERDFDMAGFIRSLYSEQIAGFYDPETNEFVVVSEDDTLDAGEQLTHAHEFVHALQDQHFNLDFLDDESLDADASAALTALAEGEATQVETEYMLSGNINLGDLLLTALDALDSPVLNSAPPVIANSLMFPYTAGQEFVQALTDEGGYAAVDDAWANPPQSTEQILHPDRYLAGDEPQLVTLPPLTDTLGAGWTLVDEDVFGEFMLREYLQQQLSEQQVDTAVTGWGGDKYATYYNEADDALVTVLRIAWDTAQDSTEFAALYPNYPARLFKTEGEIANGRECWQGDDVICLAQDGRETVIVRAPDMETAVTVLESLEIGNN
ncbi:MAG TPA: hypothetical protein ENJ93_08740 [Chloroflexi bacterium]|nr:hypothetical protein [Chloroflexota bacterium]